MISLNDLVPVPSKEETAHTEPEPTQPTQQDTSTDTPTFKGWVRDPSWPGYPPPIPKESPTWQFFHLIRDTYNAIELAYISTGDLDARRRMREAVASTQVREVEEAMGGIRAAFLGAGKAEWQKRVKTMKDYKEGCAWIKAFVIGSVGRGKREHYQVIMCDRQESP